jgi:hypothetical protein
MNYIDARVIAITGEPYANYNKWWLPVRYESYGRESDTKLMFNTEQEARDIQIGHKFLT